MLQMLDAQGLVEVFKFKLNDSLLQRVELLVIHSMTSQYGKFAMSPGVIFAACLGISSPFQKSADEINSEQKKRLLSVSTLMPNNRVPL